MSEPRKGRQTILILCRPLRGLDRSQKIATQGSRPGLLYSARYRGLVEQFMIKLQQAESSEQIEQARQLFKEYAAWLEIDLCFQGFEKELAELPGDYAPPDGRLLLAYDDAQLAGCVALRKIDEGICEMKRLFLRDKFRGKGLGRSLIEAIINEATQIGYECMRLDTLPPKMDKAIALYNELGFKKIEPYYDNPVPGAMFMELSLNER